MGDECLEPDPYHIHYPSVAHTRAMSYARRLLGNSGWPENSHSSKGKTKRGKASARRKLLRLLTLQNYKCFFCDEPATVDNSNVDHVTPLSAGGSRKFNNLVAAHKVCNNVKGCRLPTSSELSKLHELHKEFKDV